MRFDYKDSIENKEKMSIEKIRALRTAFAAILSQGPFACRQKLTHKADVSERRCVRLSQDRGSSWPDWLRRKARYYSHQPPPSVAVSYSSKRTQVWTLPYHGDKNKRYAYFQKSKYALWINHRYTSRRCLIRKIMRIKTLPFVSMSKIAR